MKKRDSDIRYTGLRPKSSPIGAKTRGPTARPSMYVVIPRVIVVLEVIPNSFIIPGAPEIYDVEKKTLNIYSIKTRYPLHFKWGIWW